MPKREQLSDFERGQILAFRDQNLNQNAIAAKIGRNQCTVSRFLKDPENYGHKKRSGRPAKLSNRDIRNILRVASSGNKTAGEIKCDQNLSVTTRRVQQILHSSPNLKWTKRK